MSILQNLITSLPRILNLDSKILVSIRDKVRKLKKNKALHGNGPRGRAIISSDLSHGKHLSIILNKAYVKQLPIQSL